MFIGLFNILFVISVIVTKANDPIYHVNVVCGIISMLVGILFYILLVHPNRKKLVN